jgi:carbon storage regulator CsrA
LRIGSEFAILLADHFKDENERTAMLVLSRKEGERIRIGRNIYVTLVRSSDGKARIGIDAPQEVEVVRVEIDQNPPEVSDTKNPCPMGKCCPLGQCKLAPPVCRAEAV